MTEKEGGDSEKKMTKDFLDRWKKIASKYEGPEGEAEKPKAGDKPAAKSPEDLDSLLADISAKGEGQGPEPPAKKADEQDLDAMMADFGFDEDDDEPAKAPAPPAKKEAPAPTPVAAAPAAPSPSAEDAQKRVLETLKKVGLVKGSEPVPPAAPPSPKAPEHEEEEEDTLMLELESLLTDDDKAGPTGAKVPGGAPSKSRAALEEEDLIAELEGLLEGEGEEEHEEPKAVKVAPVVPPPKVPAVERISPSRPAGVPSTVEARVTEVAFPSRAAPAEIKPPSAPISPPSAAPEVRLGRTNGGAVNGGRTNGGRVNGGRVNGGRVNGGRVNGGRVNGGRVNGGRVNGGRVNGGRVNGGHTNGGHTNGGRVNGGKTNGGRTNGGRVNGGRVNGGRVNGGRVNGGRINGGAGIRHRDLPPLLRVQNRRQTVVSLAVAVAVVMGLVIITPFGAAPRGPVVDADLSDWAGTSAVRYTDARDSSLPPALDLLEYSVRADGGRLWFMAQFEGNLFSRAGGPGSSPSKADDFLLLIDVDGSAGTGYSYAGLGVDRVVEVYGWEGTVKGHATRAWTNRADYDFAGFGSSNGLDVAARENRIEGTLTGLAASNGGSIANARVIFEMRGVDTTGAERLDSSASPATVTAPSLQATVTPVAPGTLTPGNAGNAPLLGVVIANPSPTAVHLASVRVTGTYAPLAPADLATVNVFRDINENGLVDGPDASLLGAASVLPQSAATLLTFGSALTISPSSQVSLLVVVDHAPTNAVNGTSLGLSVGGASDLSLDGGALLTLKRAPVLLGRNPVAYIGAAPAGIAVDGNPLEWASRVGATDRTAEVADGHIDLTGLKGNATATQASFLVSFSSTPLGGAILPLKLPSSLPPPNQQGGGGGGGGTPPVSPPITGGDFLWLMIDGDANASTGLATGGHGYDFAVRVDGKDGRVLPDGARLFAWEVLPTPAWTLLTQVPSVGFGASTLEIGAPLPPVNLTAPNITVTAYATDWLGARDDLDSPFTFPNDLGSRAELLPPNTMVGPGDERIEPPWHGIPEFGEMVAPVSLTMIVALVLRRRRAKAPQEV